jgi:hypothetical protein
MRFIHRNKIDHSELPCRVCRKPLRCRKRLQQPHPLEEIQNRSEVNELGILLLGVIHDVRKKRLRPFPEPDFIRTNADRFVRSSIEQQAIVTGPITCAVVAATAIHL